MEKDIKNMKLFLVDFGQPDLGGYMSFGGSQRPIFVIANDYNEAAEKAMSFAESKLERQSVVGYDGSLNTPEELKIKSVRVVSDEIVW